MKTRTERYFDEYNAQIIERVLVYRKRNTLTQIQLAQQLGITVRLVALLETNPIDIKISVLQQTLTKMGIPMTIDIVPITRAEKISEIFSQDESGSKPLN